MSPVSALFGLTGIGLALCGESDWAPKEREIFTWTAQDSRLAL